MGLFLKYFKNLALIMLVGKSLANVTISVGDVSVSGYTEDIVVPVTLSNPENIVGGFQFDVIVLPTLIELSGASAVDADNFSADYNIFDDGSGRIVFYSGNGSGIAQGGDDIVMNLHYDGSEILSANLDLELFDLTVSDENGNIIEGDLQNGSITIGDVVILSATTDTGDVSEEVYIDIELQNSGSVGGLQFDIYDTPNYLDVINFTTTDRSSGFSVDFNELENGATRVIVYDANNSNIDPGSGAILNMELMVHVDAYNSNVGVNFENVTVTDGIGGTYWVSSADSGTVTVSPGYIEEPHNLEAQNGMDAQVLLNWEAPYGPIPEDFFEDFEEGVIPDDFTTTTNSAQGWFITQDGSSAFWGIPSHTWYMCSNDDMADDDGSMDYLIAPPLNVSGAENITLNFASYYDGAYGQTAHIEVSTDGNSFTEVTSLDPMSEWVTESVDLSEYAGVSNLYIAFHADDNDAWASGWAVDDILVTFGTRDLNRVVHYELTQLGQWSVTAPKSEVIREFPGGIPHDLKVDLQSPILEENRPVNIDAFKVYRSLSNSNGFEEIAEVGGNTTTYLDEEVVNSTTYYYQVTAIYPDGSESGPTNTVSATPVEWVEISMDDGSSLSGQTDTLDIYMNNESDISLFYFEISDYPDVINILSVIPTDRTQGWSWPDPVNNGDGSMQFTGYAIGSSMGPGDGAVCRIVVYPNAEEELNVNLSFSSATQVQDANFVDLNWTAENAMYEVGIETQTINLLGGFGLSGEQTDASVFIQNTQPVYGIQLDILADPPFVSGADLAFNEFLNLDTWEVSGSEVGGNIYRIFAFDNTMSNPIEPGSGHLVDIVYDIYGGIPDETIVDITVDEAVLTDVNNLPMYTEGTPHAFYIGQPPVACTIENLNGELTPGGIATFEVHLENTESFNILEFYIMDMPNNMTVTNVTLMNRFEDGVIDGNTEEQEDGNFYFLGFDFSSGVEPGEGAIMEVEVQFSNVLDNSSVVFMFSSIAAGDVNANPIVAIGDSFGQFYNGTLSNSDETSLPEEFALNQNYPNPFNPSTIIPYDLSKDSNVKIEIFDLMGRNIKVLFEGNQSAGHHKQVWMGTDNFGNPVGAGVYLCKMFTPQKVFMQKMILMK